MKLQPLRGTKDLLGTESSTFRQIDDVAWQTAKLFGYQEISTPIIESTDVFKRSLGETTDIINKEMYTFDDRGGDSITLRPEGTAGVARAFISNGLYRQTPVKFYYNGPMFRYERPQKGRQRQFHQLGAEVLGVESSLADIEVISFASLFLEKLNLSPFIQLEINTLGDQESRNLYREALVKYFTTYKGELSEDSQKRLISNPLRILDSKDEQDQKLSAEAPRFSDYLNETSKTFFSEVLSHLEALDISYSLNEKLVRGLDYYCHTVFEFTTTELGSQNAVLSGGRYDSLIQNMGGKSTPGIGWAAGIERLSMLMSEKNIPSTPSASLIAAIAMGPKAQEEILKSAQELRKAGHAVEILFSGNNIGKAMKKADKLNARSALIIGDEELSQGTAVHKDFKTGEQRTADLNEILKSIVS